MSRVAFAIVAILSVGTPAMARDHIRHGPHGVRRYGIPITAGNNDIRINAVGEVLSTPPPPISSQTPRMAPPTPAPSATKP